MAGRGRAKGTAKVGGRKKGVPNKATILARTAIGMFVDDNAHRLQKWLDKIEKVEGPLAAFNCFTALLEFHVPKLGRLEHTGAEGKPISVEHHVGKQPQLLGDYYAKIAEATAAADPDPTVVGTVGPIRREREEQDSDQDPGPR